MRNAAGCLAALVFASQVPNTAPDIRDETPGCVKTGSRPKLCVRVLDDKGVAKVWVRFRAAGEKAFFQTDLVFDGARFCGWLPRPKKAVRGVEYYCEAVDEEFEPTRTVVKELKLGSACEAVSDAPAEPTHVTPVQAAKKLSGFEPDTFVLAPTPR